jgi:hypothetical protein
MDWCIRLCEGVLRVWEMSVRRIDSTKKLVVFELSVRSIIVFAKLVYPQQLLYSVKRGHKINEDSQALVNQSAGSRLSGQLD